MEKNIKALREQAGMSQARFADYFGIKVRTLQDWEAGRFAPTHGLADLMEYKLRNEGFLDKNAGNDELDQVSLGNEENPEFRGRLQKHLWRSELMFRANELPHGSCVDWLAPYCDTTTSISWFLRDLGFRIAETVDEEPVPGEVHRWVVTTGGIVVYANLPGDYTSGLVCGRIKDKTK